jgi:hypothetical protein
MRRLTLEELIASDKECFTPDDICGVLGVDPHSIRVAAKQRPDLLGFNFFFIGTRMKIPKIPFLQKMGFDIKGGQYEQ